MRKEKNAIQTKDVAIVPTANGQSVELQELSAKTESAPKPITFKASQSSWPDFDGNGLGKDFISQLNQTTGPRM